MVYGQSVGSGPASELASKRKLGGVVLHSPVLSGIKVIDPRPERCCRPSCVFSCFDFFPNDRRIKQTRCPVFITHGQSDRVVPFYHGVKLLENCPEDFRWPPYFPPGAGHNDIMELDRRAFFGELSNFLRDVKRRLRGSAMSPHMVREVELSGLQAQALAVDREDSRYEQIRRGQVSDPLTA